MLKLKNQTLLFFILCLIFDICYSQVPEIEWQNTIGGFEGEMIGEIRTTSDGGYIIGADSYSGISGDKSEGNLGSNDYWVIKLNAAGNIDWQNTIGGNAGDDLNTIDQTADGGYIIGGESRTGINSDKTEMNYGLDDFWVVKLNAIGSIQWQNSIGGISNEELKVARQTADHGFVLGGYSESLPSGEKTAVNYGSNDYFVVKLDSTGALVWQKSFGGNASDILYSLIQTSDGGFLIGGYSLSNISGNKTELNVGISDCWIVKLNSNGDIEWQNTIGGNQGESVKSMLEIEGEGYLLGCESYSGISGDKSEASFGYNDFWVIKIDYSGNIIWQKTIGGNGAEYLGSIDIVDAGGFIIGGYSSSNISGYKTEDCRGAYDYWVVRISSTGDVMWTYSIQGGKSDALNSIYQTLDGGYILGGYSDSGIGYDKTETVVGGTIHNDLWIVKLFPDCIPSPELCNTLDDNCNGLIDDGITETISISAAGPTTFCQGGSVVLSAIYSGATVQWKKDGVNIAGATSANYTVTKKGNYTCTTTSACGTATSTGIYVTVNKNPNASISAGGATTFCAGGSVTLTEVPSGGCTYQWYKGPSAIAGATTTNYIATTTGNYKCRVTKTATGCYKNSNAIAVSVPCKEGEWSVVNGESDFTIYPNPANDKLNIQINSNLLSPFSFLLTITDLEGRIIHTSELNSTTAEINISNFATGMYFVKVTPIPIAIGIGIEGEEMIEKFIKN